MTGKLLRLALIAAILMIAWFVRDGFGDVGGALRSAGWTGVAALAAFHLLPMALCGLAWSALLPNAAAPVFILSRWVRDGVGELAGFLPLSGELASARVLIRFGIRPALASALMVVDLTAEVMAQFLFSLIGVGVWLTRHPSSEVVRAALVGLVVSIPVLAAFVMVQRSTVMRFVETLPSRLMPKTWTAPDAEAGLLAAIHSIHAGRLRITIAVLTHLAAWLIATGEAGLALWLLGRPLPLADVLALESVIFALRSAAFFVPSAIGVQEGGYVLVGAALGLPPELALAVSLLKRGREAVLGVPALLAWHLLDSHRQ